MIICRYNIQQAVASKIGVIEHMVEKESLDVLILTECDILHGEDPPNVKGFNTYYQNSSIKRICVYVKIGMNPMEVKIISSQDPALPAVLLNFANFTLICVYNEFKLNAYLGNATKLTKLKMFERLQLFYDNLITDIPVSKNRVLIGDINLN